MPFSHIIPKLANLNEFSQDSLPFSQFSYDLSIESLSDLIPAISEEIFFYWSDRDTKQLCLAIGTADLVATEDRTQWLSLFDCLHAKYRTSSNLRYYGGLSFSQKSGRDLVWTDIPEMMFFLPLVEIRQQTDSVKLLLNVNTSNQKEDLHRILFILEKLQNSTSFSSTPLKTGAVTESLNKDAWNKTIKAAHSQFSNQALTKVVLARDLQYEFTDTPSLEMIANYVKPSPGEFFSFAYSFGNGAYFFGRSPEKLFRIDSGSLETEALAGTVKAENSQTLISDTKLINEHSIVCQEIEGVLSELCEAGTEISDLKIFHSKGLAHLIKTYHARLHANKSAKDVLKLLHPTSAVCGIPREHALNFIDSQEPFERGWYAGTVGWVEQKNAIISVAIRSCLLRERYLKIFAGAGIIAESTAESEWDEIGLKLDVLKPMEIE